MIKIAYLSALACFLLTGCQGLQTFSSRKLDHYKMEESPWLPHKCDFPPQKNKNTPIYVKKKSLTIVSKKSSNQAEGSLFQENDQRSMYFQSKPILTTDSYVDVYFPKIAQVPEKKIQTSQPKEEGSEKQDEMLTELFKLYPSLEPEITSPPLHYKPIRMKVTHINQEGDILLSYERTSESNESLKTIKMEAKLPYSVYRKSNQIQTTDLSNIHFEEVSNLESIVKASPSWEDEYTLRVLGFQEARSKQAIDLQKTREELKTFADKLHKKTISLQKEKDVFIKEKEMLLKEKEKLTLLQNSLKAAAPAPRPTSVPTEAQPAPTETTPPTPESAPLSQENPPLEGKKNSNET